jgi:hypothetical protein
MRISVNARSYRQLEPQRNRFQSLLDMAHELDVIAYEVVRGKHHHGGISRNFGHSQQ